jgi:hypothetical protein
VQACLQRLVEPSLTVDGKFGPRSTAAVKEFQRRVAEFVPGTALTVDGAVGPATIAALQRATAAAAPVLHAAAVAAPAADEPEAGHEAEVEAEADADQHEDEAAAVVAPGDTYVERRIKVRTYGTLAARSPLLVPVPSVNGRPKRLHVVAAAALARMAEAAARDLGIELKLASAWRADPQAERAVAEVGAEHGAVHRVAGRRAEEEAAAAGHLLVRLLAGEGRGRPLEHVAEHVLHAERAVARRGTSRPRRGPSPRSRGRRSRRNLRRPGRRGRRWGTAAVGAAGRALPLELAAEAGAGDAAGAVQPFAR